MDNKTEIFKNEQFGEVRTILEGETLLFCGSDIAKALGYARPGKAIIDHCKGVLKRDTLTSGGMQSLSYIPEKADVIYRVIILALQMGNQVLDHLTDPNVALLFKMERNANNEILHEQGFLRFEKLASGVLFARINPKNAILPYLAYHFADRFPEENWVIADTTHGSMMIHERGKGCSYIHAKDEDFDRLLLSYSEEEEVFQKLWKRYIDSVGIKARENISLQNQMLPLRFRKYMKEF